VYRVHLVMLMGIDRMLYSEASMFLTFREVSLPSSVVWLAHVFRLMLLG